MDIDPDDDNGVEAGAIDDDEEVGYSTKPKPRKRRKQTTGTTAEDEAHDAATPSNLHQDDPGNFLKLCTALKILVAPTITEAELQEADGLIREYGLELVHVCFSNIKHCDTTH
jgi:hypothetical protein